MACVNLIPYNSTILPILSVQAYVRLSPTFHHATPWQCMGESGPDRLLKSMMMESDIFKLKEEGWSKHYSRTHKRCFLHNHQSKFYLVENNAILVCRFYWFNCKTNRKFFESEELPVAQLKEAASVEQLREKVKPGEFEDVSEGEFQEVSEGDFEEVFEDENLPSDNKQLRGDSSRRYQDSNKIAESDRKRDPDEKKLGRIKETEEGQRGDKEYRKTEIKRRGDDKARNQDREKAKERFQPGRRDDSTNADKGMEQVGRWAQDRGTRRRSGNQVG